MEINVEGTKKRGEGYEFEVNVSDPAAPEELGGDGSSSHHTVTMTDSFFKSLNTSLSPEDVVREAFRFLLEREGKEQILSKFDITDISRYFPEFEEEISKTFKKDPGLSLL